MNALADCGQQMGWPETVVCLGILAVCCFLLWLVAR